MFSDISKVILITDMDGTLLRPDKTVSQENLDAIDRFRGKGGTFVVATGRNYETTIQYFDLLKLSGPVIMYNGGMVYDVGKGKVVWGETLPDEMAREAMAVLLGEFPNVAAEVSVDGGVYVVQRNATSYFHEKISGISRDRITDVASIDDVPSGWYKVLFAMESEVVPKFAAFAQTLSYAKYMDFVTSGDIYHEMLRQNSSKGDALKALIDIYKLEGYTVVAMGDYNNDITMLEGADFSACPSSAIDDVKQISNMICKADSENAVAEVIDFIMK